MALPDSGFRSPWKAPIPPKRKNVRLAYGKLLREGQRPSHDLLVYTPVLQSSLTQGQISGTLQSHDKPFIRVPDYA